MIGSIGLTGPLKYDRKNFYDKSPSLFYDRKTSLANTHPVFEGTELVDLVKMSIFEFDKLAVARIDHASTSIFVLIENEYDIKEYTKIIKVTVGKSEFAHFLTKSEFDELTSMKK